MAEHERSEFRAKLREFIGSDNTHFCPPESVKMTYPCAVYNPDRPFVRHANNTPYKFQNAYTVTFISRDPEWIKPEEVLRFFKHSSYEREFISDQLKHWVFRIFY